MKSSLGFFLVVVALGGGLPLLPGFAPPALAADITGYTLINADTDLPIMALTPGAVLDLATLPTRHLNIRANTSPTPVGSVRMVLSGTTARTQTESVVPYALFGDNGFGDYSPWVPALGSYTLTGRPYTGGGGTGTAGTALTISFSVQNQLAKAAPATLATPLRAIAYPNPSPDDRYLVALPQPLEGRVKYVLRSELGLVIATGQVQLSRPTSVLTFDFSRQMQSAGVYYLLLEGPQKVMRVQLLANQ